MPSTRDLIDLETLLRTAVSSIAVAAYSRDISISAHIDNRLPCRVLGDATALGTFLRRGLARAIDAGQTKKVAIAFWLDDREPGSSESGILLEACRAVPEGEKPMTSLTGIWTLPTGEGTAQPVAARQSGGIDTVLIPLPCKPAPDAPLMLERWQGSLQGRYLLHLRDVLYDQGKFMKSVAAAGMEGAFASTPEEALELSLARADKGQSVDFLMLDGHRLGAAAITLAKKFRADPRLAGVRIVLSIESHEHGLSDEDAALFDAVPKISMPWRRLMDLLHDFARESVQNPASTPAPQPAASRLAGDIPALAGRRILIAEDVATNQMLLQAVLASTGAEVEVVANGAEVLKRHSETPADMIVMDLQMPGMGGIAAMRELRALDGELGAVPVLALTAYAGSADRQLALDAGMDAYMAKPIIVAEFYDLLHRLLPGNGDG